MAELATRMTVIGIKTPGGPEMLVPEQRAVPTPGDGEILVKVAAAGINRPDVMQRQGLYPPPPGAPDIPGLEIACEIVALGTNVKRWKLGDRVMALVIGGGYAEYCLAHEGHALPVGTLSMIEAAGIPENYLTVWHNVFERGRLKRGESLLVHGGSSGIGTTAIQLARALGSTVFATAGSAEKCAACERLGAAKAVNYHEVDFVAAFRDATAGRGVDVILDMVGGDYLPRNLDLLALEGRLVQSATLGGAMAQINLTRLLQGRLTITGSTLRARPVAEKGAIAARVREHVWPLLESGRVAP